MIRNTAREIAVHLAYELSFTDKTVKELLDERLTKEYFDTLKDEDDIYEKAPGAAQTEYIRSIVSGVAEHAPELDGYIAKYAKGWSFDRIPLVASAIMRVATDREDHLLFHAFSCEAFFLCRCRIYKAERRRARCSASSLILR